MSDLNSNYFEIGPIRPPSEAHSLLIRATRNCPWNKCEFCSTYKGTKFEIRSVGEIKKDILTARTIADGIKTMSVQPGQESTLKEMAAMVFNNPRYNTAVRSVALWLYFDAQSAFLQDANTIIMKTPDLVDVIDYLRETFPSLTRITSYGRSKTVAKKSLEELKEIHKAGLSRMHIGLETGYNDLLNYIQKGATAGEHIEAGKKAKQAGINLCEYIIPGIGGKHMSKAHVEETARVINEIQPDFVRLRSLHLREAMPLSQKLLKGDFEPLTEDEVVDEIGAFIERLDTRSQIKSDHILNLLSEVEGKLPEDKERILAVIHRYLSLPEKERLNFQMGRRAGYYEKLDDLQDARKHEHIMEALRRIEARNPSEVGETITNLKAGFI
ncbi:radical SAM protein [Chloroflexota bacterium]